MLVYCFGCLFVWVVSWLALERSMSPRFRRVRPPPLFFYVLHRFLYQYYCLRCLSAWCWFILDNLWNAVVCFQTPSLLIGKVWVPVMHFCACPKHCEVHWRVGRMLGSCRLISTRPLIGSTIRELSISSVLWVFEALCCLYWQISIKSVTAC